MKKNVLKEIIRFAITVLSAVGAALGVQSCTVYSGNNGQPTDVKQNIVSNDSPTQEPTQVVVTYKD